jgi:Dpy-30 motif
LQYLEVNVTPYLTRSLIHIERTRPADPIQYLIDALEAQSRKNRAHAEATARAEFNRVLREAEHPDTSEE